MDVERVDNVELHKREQVGVVLSRRRCGREEAEAIPHGEEGGSKRTGGQRRQTTRSQD